MDVAAQLNAVLSDRYSIEREIGAGGMATVYLARDIKHNRKVALKVLKPELGIVLGSDRFLTEIETTANLQHPHILPLFDSGEVNGLLYFVMPYVEGETLHGRLERERQLPVDEAVRIAVAVASALDYAHRRGVIHRDLKPENILLHDGQPLVADFGIALAVSKAGGARVTQSGLSLGTPQYMSPEQATGDRGIDARSDIYSLAAVIYEMLTGDPPHQGSTTQAVIARVLTDRPQHPRIIRETVPEHVDAAIMCGLAKLPADRFTSAGEFAEALSGTRAVALPRPATMQQTVTYEVVPVGKRARLKRALAWAPLGILAVVLSAIAIESDDGIPDHPSLFQITFADSTEALSLSGVSVAISRDGSQMAFVGNGPSGRVIYHRALDQFEARPIRGTENGLGPEFSPDGSELLFSDDNQLKKLPISGGAPILVADSASNQGSWSERGEVIFHLNRPTQSGGIKRISAEGGQSTLVAAPDSGRGHLRYAWPHVMPGGKTALITLWKGGTTNEYAQLGVLRLDDRRVTELNVPGFNPRYLKSGHIVFGRSDGSVFAASFSRRRLRLTGPPVPVLENVAMGTGGAVRMAVSDNGTLLYQTVGEADSRNIVRVDRSGREQVIRKDSVLLGPMRIDPSGRYVAIPRNPGRRTSPETDIWVLDLNSNALTRLTSDSMSGSPEWTPDGKSIAFGTGSRGRGAAAIFRRPWDGSGIAEAVTDTGIIDISFSRTGKYLAVLKRNNGGIWIAPTDSPRAVKPFVVTSAVEGMPAVSPDGRLLAYATEETGRSEVYVRPLPGPGGRIPVSVGGGIHPVWSPSGTELFYRSPTHVMAATITERPILDVVRSDTLFADVYTRSFGSATYDVFPNGQAFLFTRNMAATQRGFFGIANWTEEVTRRTREAKNAGRR